jgi:hypothetical protein
MAEKIYSYKDLIVWQKAMKPPNLLPFGNKLSYNNVDNLLSEIMRMINKMLSSMRNQSALP